MRTAEYVAIMQRQTDQFMVESLETKTEWGTTYYQWVVYMYDLVVQELTDQEEKDFEDDGIVAVLGSNAKAIAQNDSFDKAVEELFYYLHDNNLLED